MNKLEGLMGPKTGTQTAEIKLSEPVPAKPTKCRVFLPGKGQLAIIGPGCNAFDAEFDWTTLCAMGKVEGYDVLVHVSQANITFYRE